MIRKAVVRSKPAPLRFDWLSIRLAGAVAASAPVSVRLSRIA